MLLRKHGPQIFVNPHGFKTCRYQRGNLSSKDFVKFKSDKDFYQISHENDMLNCIFHEFNET